MKQPAVIDCDGHVAEPWEMYQSYADPEFRDRIPRRVDAEGHRLVVANGRSQDVSVKSLTVPLNRSSTVPELAGRGW